jgi:hypothetical protein
MIWFGFNLTALPVPGSAPSAGVALAVLLVRLRFRS